MSIEAVRAIDVHGHYGIYRGAVTELQNRLMTADAAEVARYARIACTELTVVSPLKALMPKFAGDAVAGNEETPADTAPFPELRYWTVLHPGQPETYAQADRMLADPRCAGIKLHPEAHGYPIREFGEQLFGFAAARKAVVLVHSGEQLSLPEDFALYADAYPEIRIILAHLGWSWNGDYSLQVQAIQRSRQGNLYVDTSSSLSIVPNLLEWAVGEIGAQFILYGTDTPLYSTPMQRARIDKADLGDAEKKLILRDNAIRLLKLDI